MGHLLDGTVALYQCHHTGGNQEWSFTSGGLIKHHDLCLTLVNFLKGKCSLLRLRFACFGIFFIVTTSLVKIQCFRYS